MTLRLQVTGYRCRPFPVCLTVTVTTRLRSRLRLQVRLQVVKVTTRSRRYDWYVDDDDRAYRQYRPATRLNHGHGYKVARCPGALGPPTNVTNQSPFKPTLAVTAGVTATGFTAATAAYDDKYKLRRRQGSASRYDKATGLRRYGRAGSAQYRTSTGRCLRYRTSSRYKRQGVKAG